MSVRITGGEFRGRVLNAPSDDRVRPTTDRNRLALFNMLNAPRWADKLLPETEFDLDGAVVLDAFAGTGALGFESLSRGASFVHAFEKDRMVAGLYRRNAESLRVTDRVGLLVKDSTKPGARPASLPPANLVFLDPPYRQGLIPRALNVLVKNGWLAQGAVAVLESEKEAPAGELSGPDCRVHDLDSRLYGSVLFRIVQIDLR